MCIIIACINICIYQACQHKHSKRSKHSKHSKQSKHSKRGKQAQQASNQAQQVFITIGLGPSCYERLDPYGLVTATPIQLNFGYLFNVCFICAIGLLVHCLLTA